VLALDLAELNSIPEFVTSVLAVYNQVDILINNGGISVRADVASTAVDVDLKVMVVNYFGSVALTKGEKRKNFHKTIVKFFITTCSSSSLDGETW